MSYRSAPELLIPHTLRVLGRATVGQVAALRSVPTELVEEHLEDARAFGLVSRSTFGGPTSWHLTELGKAKGETALADELEHVAGRDVVTDAHAQFLPLNRRIGTVMTQWQLRPTRSDPLAPNDHRDAAHDDAVIRRLTRLVDELRPITLQLTTLLARFELHQPRMDTAVQRAAAGSNSWVDAPDVPSLNICWIQLHEDLLATLGIERGSDDPTE